MRAIVHRVWLTPAALLLGLAWAVGAARPAAACSCEPPPAPKEAMGQASAVFSGEVVKVERLDDEQVRATIKVASAWKGGVAGEVPVTTTAGDGLCGFPFREGESYLVYADGDPWAGALSTDTCTRTRHVFHAEEDLKELGPPAGGEKDEGE